MIALYLGIGFGMLLLGGELLVRGGVGIALKAQISKVVIGLTLVAFATSAPELIVSTIAAMQGKSDIALGNVIGSNITNIGLILGTTALFFHLDAIQLKYKKDWQFLIAANVLLGVFLFLGHIPRYAGLLFLGLLAAYNVQKIRSVRSQRKSGIGEQIEGTSLPVWKGIALLLLGAISLKFGAQFFVAGISDLALFLGLSERVVSITMVAFGTSVPELAATMLAARKGETDIAVGNIIGSNIFNILSVLGVTSIIAPIHVQDPALRTFDFPVSLLLTLLIIPLMGVFKPDQLSKKEGALLLGIYISYTAYLYF